MNSFRHAVARTALGVAEYMTPVLRESKFRETGVITPEEFVAAGDFLVHHCPTWQWASGDKNPRSFLPPDKQFLLTRNVPCYKRVKDVNKHNEDMEKLVDEDELGGGWVDTHHYATSHDQTTVMEHSPVMANQLSNTRVPTVEKTADNNEEGEEEEEDFEDMEAFVQSGMLDEVDPSVATAAARLKIVESSDTTAADLTPETTGILQTRTYDLYMTYDKYYQTPRLWLFGYNEHHEPLTGSQMFEDFSQDHANKTVTTEQHPHLSGHMMPSIHPCRQAEVMRKLIEAVADGGSELAVHQYLLIFLKFVQAVIPTIEYDYTRNFHVGAMS